MDTIAILQLEKNMLDKRRFKLTNFIYSGASFDSLDKEEKRQLISQRGFMGSYSRILGERIKVLDVNYFIPAERFKTKNTRDIDVVYEVVNPPQKTLIDIYNSSHPEQHTEIKYITSDELVIDQLKELKQEYLAEIKAEEEKLYYFSFTYRELPNLNKVKSELNKFLEWTEKRLSKDCSSN